MNDLFQSLFGQLKGTSLGTRVVALVSVLGLVAVLGAATWLSNRPDFQLAFSSLSDHELAKVNRALSEAGIAFDVSQPPAPFSVYVDESERSSAYMAVYGAGALDKPLEGILTDSNISSVFHSAEERQQGVRKREWAEMELLLEELDFVAAAHVRTSPRLPGPNVFAERDDPLTASVTLTLAGSTRLSAAQAETVADLVSRGLGVRKENLVVSDQSGNRLYDGEPAEEDEAQAVHDLLAHQAEFDRRSTDAANEVLTTILGPNKARVAVTSEWDFDQSTLRTETPVGKGSLVEESKSTSERPLGEPAARAVGISSNVAAVEGGAEPGDAGAETVEASAPLERTNEEKKSYRPTISLEERVRVVPSLERLSVALFLDQSIEETEKQSLEDAVKAAVGFVEERDTFQAAQLAFFSEPPPEASPETVADAAPSPWVGTLLRRGVEIVSALAFVLLLMRSLKSARASGAAAAAAPAQPEIDPELLARAQIDELLKSDPKRVGAILSSWVRSEPASAASARQEVGGPRA